MIQKISELLEWEKSHKINYYSLTENDIIELDLLNSVAPEVIFERLKMIGNIEYFISLDNVMSVAFHRQIEVKKYIDLYIENLKTFNIIQLLNLEQNNKSLSFLSSLENCLCSDPKSYVMRAFESIGYSLLDVAFIYKEIYLIFRRIINAEPNLQMSMSQVGNIVVFFDCNDLFDANLVLELVYRFGNIDPKRLVKLYDFSEIPAEIMHYFDRELLESNGVVSNSFIEMYTKLMQFNREEWFFILFDNLRFYNNGVPEIFSINKEKISNAEINNKISKTIKNKISKNSILMSVNNYRKYFDSPFLTEFIYILSKIDTTDEDRAEALAFVLEYNEVLNSVVQLTKLESDNIRTLYYNQLFDANFNVVRLTLEKLKDHFDIELNLKQGGKVRVYLFNVLCKLLINHVMNGERKYRNYIDDYLSTLLLKFINNRNTDSNNELSRLFNRANIRFFEKENIAHDFKVLFPKLYELITTNISIIEYILSFDKFASNDLFLKYLNEIDKINLKSYHNLMIELTNKPERFDLSIVKRAHDLFVEYIKNHDFTEEEIKNSYIFYETFATKSSDPEKAYYFNYALHKDFFEKVAIKNASMRLSSISNTREIITKVVNVYNIIRKKVGFSNEEDEICNNIDALNTLVQMRNTDKK